MQALSASRLPFSMSKSCQALIPFPHILWRSWGLPKARHAQEGICTENLLPSATRQVSCPPNSATPCLPCPGKLQACRRPCTRSVFRHRVSKMEWALCMIDRKGQALALSSVLVGTRCVSLLSRYSMRAHHLRLRAVRRVAWCFGVTYRALFAVAPRRRGAANSWAVRLVRGVCRLPRWHLKVPKAPRCCHRQVFFISGLLCTRSQFVQ